MNPSAIYSKSGKGVQEASGKTSLLKRGDRAVLSAIDGRASLTEVAQKVGKAFDAAFEQLIRQLDKDGFIREVTAGAATTGSRPVVPKPIAKAPAPAPKAAPASGSGEDLDFTSIMPAMKPGQSAPPRAPAPDKAAAQRAKEQESALHKARQEAEARAQAERDRLRLEMEGKARAEAEAKIRAETEKKLRDEAEAKLRAEADAKAKAARDAALRVAAEAKARAEAEAQARIEAERKAREEAERKAREEAEKARKEAEELRQRLEEERKAREAEERKRKEEEERRRKEEEARRAREEAERKAREEAERKRREEEERRRREEEERRAREEAERKAREEAERKAREEAERKARETEERKRKEEEERKAREQEEQARAAREEQARAAREEQARAARQEEEERVRKSLEETKIRQPTLAAAPPPQPEPAPAPTFAPVAPPPARDDGPGSLDSLMADLDSFSQREEDERAARDAAERKARDEKKRKAQEETERRAREEVEHERRQAEERRRKQEEERREQEEAERRQREVEEQQRIEAEERRRKAKELLLAAKQAQEAAEAERASASGTDDIGVTPDDLGMDDVRQDQAVIAKESRKQQREREREAKQREREARDRARAAARGPEEPVKYSRPRRPRKWGKPAAITLFLLLLGGVGVLHVMPLPMEEYEQAASNALGRPVRIASGRVSLFTGVRLNLEGVRIGDNVKIAAVSAYPEIGSLFDERKAFNRIELEGMTIAQAALGETLFAKLKVTDFTVRRILVKQLRLEGPVPLPAFEAEAALGADGALRTATLRGPDELTAQLTPAGNNVEFDVTAASFTLPFAPDVHLSSFAMKGVATHQGMNITAWGGSLLDGALSGTANLRWGGNWHMDGAVSIRNINAAVFAPALLSEGKAEGTGKFSMSGAEPAKLVSGTRIDGNFTVNKGVLGSFDLSRAIQSAGRQYNGRTQFVEMTGQGVYDRGDVALRNVIISAGALSAGASADIAAGGALSGRIVADIRTAGQSLRQTLHLGGTVKEPQVRN